jgi:hypothetical protein
MIVLSSRNLLLFPLAICVGLLCCTLVGCGTGDYEKSIKASEQIISNRDKFSVLDPKPLQFPKHPVTFRLPKLFTKEPDQKLKEQTSFNWKGYAFTPKSKDPFGFASNLGELSNANTDQIITQFKEPILLPSELQSGNSDRGHLGTFLCEGNVPLIPDTKEEDKENAKRKRWYLVQLVCWSFGNNRVDPKQTEAKAAEVALLSKIKTAGRAKPFSLQPVSAEDAPYLGPEDNRPSAIEFAAIDFMGSFVYTKSTPQDSNSSINHKGELDQGTIYLGKALIKNYTFFVALRVPKALAEESEFTPDKMKGMVLAMLGSVTLDADTLSQVPDKNSKSKTGK